MPFHDQSGQSDPAAESEQLHLPVAVQVAAPKGKRTGLIAGLSAAVVVAAGSLYALTSSGGSTAPAAQAAAVSATSLSGTDSSIPAPTTVSSTTGGGLAMKIPSSAGTLTLMTDSVGDRVTTELRQENSNLPGSAIYGAYRKTGTSTYVGNLILLELSDGDASEYQSLYTSTDADTALLQINGTTGVTGFTTETPAEPGGAMICGDMKGSQSTLHVCTWIDATEYGMAGFPATVPETQAAAYATALWKASE